MRHQTNEVSPLFKRTGPGDKPLQQQHTYCKSGCIKSKPGLIILLWNFSAMLGYNSIYNIKNISQVTNLSLYQVSIVTIFLVVSLLLFIAPLAGLLADIKFGRYKTILCSSYILIITVALLPIFCIGAFALRKYFFNYKHLFTSPAIVFVLIAAAHLVVLLISYVVFNTNALNYGMDQLHDSPAQDSLLFINWYVWENYVAIMIADLMWALLFYESFYVAHISINRSAGIALSCLSFCIILFFLIVSLCLAHRRKRWFLIETGRVNPYKLVYRVIKYAWKHKIPVCRSAFTYCEDQQPSRLDLAKRRYGGPFTFEQVEDVKAFIGVLKVLMSIGPVFMLQVVSESTLPEFSNHGYIFYDNVTHSPILHIKGIIHYIFISSGFLSPLIVVISIPLYLFMLRPCVVRHIPGTMTTILKRMGLGILLVILALLCNLIMDLVAHERHSYQCMFATNSSNIVNYTSTIPHLYQNVYFLTSQHLLSALYSILINTAILEFICSQSPYSMKGLLIGVLFSTRYLFQGLAIILMIVFSAFWKTKYSLSCGSGFYLISIAMGVVTLIGFTLVAKFYEYRTRDEILKIYQYAEDYYSKI